MPEKITLDIDIEDAPEIAEAIERQRQGNEEKILQRQSELNELLRKRSQFDEMLRKLHGIEEPEEIIFTEADLVGAAIKLNPRNGYNPKWTMWDKVHYILIKQIDPLTKGAIFDKMIMMEPALAKLSKDRLRTLSVSLLSTLSTKYKRGFLARQMGKSNEFEYYLTSTTTPVSEEVF